MTQANVPRPLRDFEAHSKMVGAAFNPEQACRQIIRQGITRTLIMTGKTIAESVLNHVQGARATGGRIEVEVQVCKLVRL